MMSNIHIIDPHVIQPLPSCIITLNDQLDSKGPSFWFYSDSSDTIQHNSTNYLKFPFYFKIDTNFQIVSQLHPILLVQFHNVLTTQDEFDSHSNYVSTYLITRAPTQKHVIHIFEFLSSHLNRHFGQTKIIDLLSIRIQYKLQYYINTNPSDFKHVYINVVNKFDLVQDTFLDKTCYRVFLIVTFLI